MRKILLAAVAATVLGALPAMAGIYTFAGVAFEQDSTPDVLGLLDGGVTIGGTTFGANDVNRITASVAFVASSVGGGGVITPQPGFNPALSLGRQANAQHGVTQSDGTACHYACAINLPRGDNGTTLRHGIEVGWSGGRTLGNGAGNDIVIYESGSAGATGAEGYMVRVRSAATGDFSAWRYEVADGFGAYLGSADGAWATQFDLSDFGLSAGAAIDLIQIANLIQADRLSGSTVSFDGTGTTHGFSTSRLDPDPLYVGILHGLNAPAAVDAPSALAAFGVGLAALGLIRRRRRD